MVGQSVNFEFDNVLLEEALQTVAANEGADIIFAARLISNIRVSNTFHGENLQDGLNTLLLGTGLHAEKVRRNQFVIVKGALVVTGELQEYKPSQTLSGYILDDETGEVLRGAHVWLVDLEVGAVTNPSGFFAISSLPAGQWLARVSYVGYEVQSVLLRATGVPTELRLEPVSFVADSLIVLGDRNETAEKSTIPGLVAVPIIELSTLPAFLGESDLFQVLQWLPSVRLGGEAGGELIIRGGESDQNLYLLDGVPLYHPWHTFGIFSVFQSDLQRDVQLFKGSLPAEFGGRLSSVLDVRMKDGNRERFGGSASISPISAQATLEMPLSKDVSMMISGRRSYLDLLFGRSEPLVTSDGKADTLRIGYFFYDSAAKISWRPSRWHKLSLSYYQGLDNLNVRVPLQVLIESNQLSFDIRHKWGNRLLNLSYNYLYGEKFFFNFTGYFSRYNAREFTEVHPSAQSLVRSNYNVQIQDIGLKVDADYYTSIQHQLRAGGSIVWHGFDSNLNSVVQLSATTRDSTAQSNEIKAIETVLYFQDTWKPTRNLTIQPGLRFTYFIGQSYSYKYLVPRFNIRLQVIPEYFSIKAGVSRQVQAIHRVRDRFSFVYDLTTSRWVPANKDVRPATGIQWAIGANSKPLPWLTVSADVFVRTFDDILLPRDIYQTKDGLEGPGIEVGALLQQYERGISRGVGVELLARVERNNWSIWFSYAGGKSKQKSKAPTASFYPTDRNVPHAWQTAYQVKLKKWRFSLAGQVRSGDPFSVPTAQYHLDDPLNPEGTTYLYRPSPNNGRLPTYYRIDASAGRRLQGRYINWDLQLQVFNITNHRNIIDRQFIPDGNIVHEKNSYGLPILPILELKATW